MTTIGLHISHEQFAPSDLLEVVQAAEQAGFGAALSSDHFAPWTEQDSSCCGHAFTWLGAAMATTRIPYGVVAAAGYRQHPAVVAQMIATLADLGPGRITPTLGSGEALNEHITGEPWPDKPARNARLAECADVVRRLLDGEEVDHDGLVRVHRARLPLEPAAGIPLFAAALSPETAAEVGSWADGLSTVDAPPERLREVVGAFRDAAGPSAPVHVQLHVSWAKDDEAARLQALERWPVNALPAEVTENTAFPAGFEERVRGLDADDLEDSVLMSADPTRHLEKLERIAELGVERIFVHQVGADQLGFVQEYADQVLGRFSPPAQDP